MSESIIALVVRLHTHEVEDPVRRCSSSRAFGSHRQRIDLCRVEPRHTLPTDPEEDVVQEEECNRRLCHLSLMRVSLLFGVSNEHGDDKITHKLAGSSVHHHLTTAPSLNIRNLKPRC